MSYVRAWGMKAGRKKRSAPLLRCSNAPSLVSRPLEDGVEPLYSRPVLWRCGMTWLLATDLLGGPGGMTDDVVAGRSTDMQCDVKIAPCWRTGWLLCFDSQRVSKIMEVVGEGDDCSLVWWSTALNCA